MVPQVARHTQCGIKRKRKPVFDGLLTSIVNFGSVMLDRQVCILATEFRME